MNEKKAKYLRNFAKRYATAAEHPKEWKTYYKDMKKMIRAYDRGRK